MKESLLSTSFKRFKSNMSSYIAVGVFCALLFVLVSTLSFIDKFIALIAVPLLALPFLFASHISCYLLEMNQPITPGAFFRYYSSFYSPQFRSSFRVLISFLKTLAVYFIALTVSGIIMFIVFYNINGALFTESINAVIREYMNGMTYEELIELLNENDGILLTYIAYVTAMPIPFAITAFFYFISFSSIAIYYRANVNIGAPSLLRLAIANTYEKVRHSMRKDWLKLNWPLLALLFVGSVSSGLICIFVFKKIAFMSPAFVIGAFILLIFFLPFYFPNMEVLYHRYENSFKEGNKKAIQIILERIQNSIELTEEEKRNLEESFKNDDEGKE